MINSKKMYTAFECNLYCDYFIGYDKENAIIVAEIKLEEKWSAKLQKAQEQWKEKGGSYYQKISNLTDDKEALTQTIRTIRGGEFEKMQEITRMKLEHQSQVERIVDMSKRTSSDSTRELKKMDEILKDKDYEIAQLTRKADLLELSKELLEKELLTYKKRVHGHDASLKTVGFNFSVTHKDLTKKIASLEATTRQLQLENEQLAHNHSASRAGGHLSRNSSPAGHDDKIRRLKRQREELRDIVTRLEEKCNDLDNRCSLMEEDNTHLVSQLEQTRNDYETLLARISELKGECDGLIHENIDLEERIRDCHVNGYAQVVQAPEQEVMIENLEQDRDAYKKELEEISVQNQSLIMRCDRLKDEYQLAREQTSRLLEEREETKNEDGQKDKQIVRLRERNQRLEQGQDRWKQKMDEQRNEIDRLQGLEQRALQADAYKRQLDEIRRHH